MCIIAYLWSLLRLFIFVYLEVPVCGLVLFYRVLYRSVRSQCSASAFQMLLSAEDSVDSVFKGDIGFQE